MKKILLALLPLSATLFLSGRLAAEDKTTDSALNREEQQLMQRFDRNHDGKLDEAELATAHESMLKANQAPAARPENLQRARTALIKRFDHDGDGKLSTAEQAEMKAWILSQFDTNHDGVVDEAERAAGKARIGARVKAKKK